MEFLGIGGWEILLILLVALLIYGPGRIVGVARSLGKIVHTLKNASSAITTQISKELEEQEKSKTDKVEEVKKIV